jgi:hypothetical protein
MEASTQVVTVRGAYAPVVVAQQDAAVVGQCDTELYADYAGRYYSTQDGYLCPPELRETGGRRHQPADATAHDPPRT